MAMIDAEVLFQTIIKEKIRHQKSLDYTYQTVGETAIAGREISEYTKGSVREYKGRIAQLEWVVKEMQNLAGV